MQQTIRTAGGIAILLALFATLAWRAVRQKSPTYDEPLHTAAAWVALYQHDFRVTPDVPPLWGYWASLAWRRDSLQLEFHPAWQAMLSHTNAHWIWSTEMLFRVPGNDGQALVARGRAMMLVIALALGILLSVWAWQLGGRVAAWVATCAFALDPNFLAHGPLMKNDVVFAFVFCLAAWATWMAGRGVTAGRLLALVVATGAALCVKFSGILVAPMVALLLLTRAVGPDPWVIGGKNLCTRWGRVAVAGAIVLALLLATYTAIWACYGFRFSATPDAGTRLDTSNVIREESRRLTETPEPFRLPLSARMAQWGLDRRVLPEAWLHGWIYNSMWMRGNPAYLNGGYSRSGWWYYFPLAMLYKTPLSTLLAITMAIVVLVSGLWRWRSATNRWEQAWTACCLLIPCLVYGAALMISNFNIGIRHALPLYPFIFVLLGMAAAHAWAWRHRARWIISLGLAFGLAGETAGAFPDYIPFFNVAAGGWRHGLELLSDSNLDWGQDLIVLAAWQRAHPRAPLYLAYWGTADPEFYGISYRNMPGGYIFGPPPQPPEPEGPACVVAISATTLQGVYLSPFGRDYYRPFRMSKPREVLGESIYLFDYPLAKER